MTWDPIFKAGTHTSSRGQTRNWSLDDLDALAKNTDIEPPVVIHHPEDQDKAVHFGKIARLKRVGDQLVAQYRGVPQILSQAVSEGLRLAKSVSIDPATMKIRHVGLLGADQPPAVAGLGPVSFALGTGTGSDGVPMTANTDEGEPLLTYFFNQQPEHDPIQAAGADPDTDDPGKEGTVDPKDQKIKDLEEKIKTLEADKTVEILKSDLSHAKEALAKAKADHDAVKEEFAKYKQDQEEEKLQKRVIALAESGRIKPADKAKVLGYAKAMSADKESTMEFTAPDGTKEQITPGEQYLRDLEALPENKDGLLSEFASQGRAGKPEENDDWNQNINDFA